MNTVDLSLDDSRFDLEPSSFHIYPSLLSTCKNEGISLGILVLAMLAGPLQATQTRSFQRRGSERTNDKESEHRLEAEMTRT